MVRNYSSQSLDLYDDKWFALTKAVAHHIVYGEAAPQPSRLESRPSISLFQFL